MKTFLSTLLCLMFLNTLKAQQINRDTLFFKYDPKYIIRSKGLPQVYYLKDSHDSSSGTFFFKEILRLDNLKNKDTKCLKKFIRSSEFYDKNKKVHDREIAALFNNFAVFLMQKTGKKTQYIQVIAGFEIE